MKPARAPDDPAERVQPTPERQQHDVLDYSEEIVFSELGKRSTSRVMVHRVRTQRVIDILHRKGALSDKQHDAAERFWDAYHRAGMVSGGMAINYAEASAASHPGSYSGGRIEAICDASRAWRDAYAVVPERCRKALKWVVCEDKAVRYLAASRGGSTEKALAASRGELVDALDALAAHWGL